MKHVTYDELTVICGKQQAYAALLVIEGSGKIRRDNIVSFDCKKRLSHALDVMSETEQAA